MAIVRDGPEIRSPISTSTSPSSSPAPNCHPTFPRTKSTSISSEACSYTRMSRPSRVTLGGAARDESAHGQPQGQEQGQLLPPAV